MNNEHFKIVVNAMLDFNTETIHTFLFTEHTEGDSIDMKELDTLLDDLADKLGL